MTQPVAAANPPGPPTPAAPPASPPPYNLLHLDYRRPPQRKIPIPAGIIDAHTHCHGVEPTRTFLDAARAYGISQVWTMSPLEDVDPLRQAFPNTFRFIAIPKWQAGGPNEEFVSDWLRRLDAFYEKGARLFKLHMAPGTKHRWKLSLDHPLIQRVIDHAYQTGYHFMSHISDPKSWFSRQDKYADASQFGTFDEQFAPLDALLEKYPDRVHLGAHMGGSLEDLPALARRLDRFPRYIIDTSATKWITRAIAQQNTADVRDFFVRYQDRIVFGTDLVINEKFSWDHYASRYWVHLKQWETAYYGAGPIEDPDWGGIGFPADQSGARSPEVPPSGGVALPQLHGLDLPPDILLKLYRGNAERLLPHAEPAPS